MRETIPVIVVNYNTAHLMPALLASLNEPAEIDIRIVIVDNGATTESLDTLKQLKDPRVAIVPSHRNLGFTGGVNYGLRYALKTFPRFGYFFLINPDAQSQRGLISLLHQYLDADHTAACISPRITDTGGMSWYSGAHMNLNAGKIDNNPKHDFYKTNGKRFFEVDVFSGCASLFRLSAIKDVGMFNEKLFMYFDEAEMSLRLKKNGYKILYTPDRVITHDVSYTTRNISHLKTYYLSRNRFYVFGRTMSLPHKIWFILYEFLFHLKNRRFKNAYYHLRGIWDYRNRKHGQLKA